MTGTAEPDSFLVTASEVTVNDSGTAGGDTLAISTSSGAAVLVQTGGQIACDGETVSFAAGVGGVIINAHEGDQFIVAEPSSAPIQLTGGGEQP